MVTLRFLHRLSIILVVLLFTFTCVFGILNYFEATRALVDTYVEGVSPRQELLLSILGLLGVFIIILGSLFRIKGSLMSRQTNTVKIMEEEPPPNEYSVPEAHPFPSCMPIPNINEPTITLTPTGETYPFGVTPVKLKPVLKIIANSVDAIPSISICACKP